MGRKKTALFSLFDKTGCERAAMALILRGWEILGSEGTVKYLAGNGINARDVAEFVGKPILGHRVVTLSREIHAALLARDTPGDQAELDALGMPRIDLVYASFYPLQKEISRTGHTLQSVIEKTDIGGPTMMRSAVKGRRIVVSHPNQWKSVLKFIDGEDEFSKEQREAYLSLCGAEAEALVAQYVLASSKFLCSQAKQKNLVDMLV